MSVSSVSRLPTRCLLLPVATRFIRFGAILKCLCDEMNTWVDHSIRRADYKMGIEVVKREVIGGRIRFTKGRYIVFHIQAKLYMYYF